MADITPARKLFDLLVSRDFDPEMLDSSGKPAPDPAEAEIFSFDFRARSGKDYGTVVIMLGDDNDLEVYCSDNVGRGMEGDDKNDWFAFLEQLKNFAVRNFMSFGIKNLNRLRYSMQGQAAIKEGLFESWTGTRTTSWNGKPTEARLMIRHKKTLGENDARFRYIESLFIETADSERYKLPFKSLTGGKAMLEHVRCGGRPYDARGNHIAEMVTELAVLSRFRRANQGQIFEGDTQQLLEQAQEYQTNLQRSLKGLATKTGYKTYFESWQPADISEQDVVIESLKNLFVKQSIDTRIESALPLLAKIQQQGTAMKEANIFEAWVNNLIEGTWTLPETPEQQSKLVELLSTELPVGADATNATEQLYDLLGDDHLFDQLEALAEHDANADCRQLVYDRLEELSDHPEVRKVIDQLQIDPTAEMNPPEGTPADLSDVAPEKTDQVPGGGTVGRLAEDSLRSIRRAAGLLTETELKENVLKDDTGSTFDHILNTFKRDVKDFEENDELSDELYNALYDYYFDDMPYGTKKGRTGDPYEWVADRFAADLGHPGVGFNSPGVPDEDYGLERESVMHGDYAEEREPHSVDGGMDNPLIQDEGVLGTVGGAMGGGMLGTMLGGAIGGPVGAMAGHSIGTAAGAVGGQELTKGGSGIIEQGEEETDEGAAAQSIGDKIGTGVGTLAGAGLGSLAGPAGMVAGGVAGNLAGGAIGSKIGASIEEEETDEGWKGQFAGGALGSMAGEIAGAPLGPLGIMAGGALGGTAGQMIGDKLGGKEKEETDESSPLAGKYGHSGKMKEVGKDTSFLDRLKELSGMKRN